MVSFIRTNKHRLARVTNLFRQQYSKIGKVGEPQILGVQKHTSHNIILDIIAH